MGLQEIINSCQIKDRQKKKTNLIIFNIQIFHNFVHNKIHKSLKGRVLCDAEKFG